MVSFNATVLFCFESSVYMVYTYIMFILKVCESLSNAKIKYAIVGGYAVALHGVVRGTVDVDLLIEIS